MNDYPPIMPLRRCIDRSGHGRLMFISLQARVIARKARGMLMAFMDGPNWVSIDKDPDDESMT